MREENQSTCRKTLQVRLRLTETQLMDDDDDDDSEDKNNNEEDEGYDVNVDPNMLVIVKTTMMTTAMKRAL